MPEASGKTPPGAVVPLIADPSRLVVPARRLRGCVIAEDRALSTQLAAEAMIAEIARVLRPGGRVLACVDSLMLGMSVLGADHWAHLVDLPHAEVVLVPWPDGTITRCYGPDQAREAVQRGRADGQVDPPAHHARRVGGQPRAAARAAQPAQPGPRRAGRQVR